MKKTYLSLAFAAVTLLACNSGTSSGSADSSSSSASTTDTSNMSTMNNGSDTGSATKMATNSKPASDMDKKFMMEAGAGGNTEILASQAALSMSNNQRVKDFANMMVNDHTKAGNELKAMASQKSVTLPDSVMEKQHNDLDDLRKTSAKNFDKQYMSMMVKDHKETVDKFKMASEKCDDGDLKTWAANTLPTLKMHTDSAMAIEKALK